VKDGRLYIVAVSGAFEVAIIPEFCPLKTSPKGYGSKGSIGFIVQSDAPLWFGISGMSTFIGTVLVEPNIFNFENDDYLHRRI